MSVTKHNDLKTRHLITKSHTDTRIRIKLVGSERCPMSSVDLSPAVKEQTFVEESAEVLPWERDGKEIQSLPVAGGPRGNSFVVYSGRGAALGESPAAAEPLPTRPPPVSGASRPTGPAAAPTAAACR